MLILCSLTSFGQYDTLQSFEAIEMDLLSTPGIPASLIMSTSPTEIVEPGSSPEFQINIQNASGNLTVFPNNYGFSFTPFWWTKRARTLSFDDDFTTDADLKFWRYLQISAGVIKGIYDNENLWRYGAGIQSTILPGRVDTKLKAKYARVLTSYHYKFIMGKDQYIAQNKLYIMYDSIQLQLRQDIMSTSNQAEKDSLFKILSNVLELKTKLDNELGNSYEQMVELAKDSLNVNRAFSHLEKRIGLKMDIGAGVAIDAQNNLIDSMNLYRLGIWTDIGYTKALFDHKSYLSLVCLARFLDFTDVLYFTEDFGEVFFEDLKVIDLGVQIKFDFSAKFAMLFEGVFRTGFDDRFKNTYRMNALMQYKFGSNRLLYLTFGNVMNESTDLGPQQLAVNIGINLGFGNPVTINRVSLP
jgi:hypothetical protein